jgi:hypothetical protein
MVLKMSFGLAFAAAALAKAGGLLTFIFLL